jgi:hypothetical protein
MQVVNPAILPENLGIRAVSHFVELGRLYIRRSAAYKQEQLEKGMLARNTALNAMGHSVAGQGEVYKTQAARLLHDYGYEPSPAPINMFDASADPPALIEYPECPGAEDEDAEESDEDAIMIFKAAHKPAVLNAQAGLIATRMRSARAILGKAIGRHICSVKM